MIITHITHHCSMEEMVTLQYSSFATLGEQAKVVTHTTGCLKRAADQTFRGQLFLDELMRENTLAGKQFGAKDGGIFLLEGLFHNASLF